MRVAQFVNTLDSKDGGPARNSFELSLALNSLPDHHADIFWISGSSENAVFAADRRSSDDLPDPGPRKITVFQSGSRSLSIRNVTKALRGYNAVIIHGYYLSWAPLVASACLLQRIPVLCMPHGSLTARQQRYSRIKKAAFDSSIGSILRRAIATFVTGSESESKDIVDRFPNAETSVAGVGVRLPDLTRPPGAVSDPIRLCTISRIAPKKRIDLAIGSVQKLQRKGVDAHLTIAGGGPPALVASLESMVKELGIENSVDFVGHLDTDQKSRLLLDADFFLLPSEDENFGIAFAEALAYGVPAITSSAVAAAEGYPEHAGRVLSVCTPETISRAVEDLSRPEKYGIASSASYEFARSSFQWTEVAERWAAVIRSVAA